MPDSMSLRRWLRQRGLHHAGGHPLPEKHPRRPAQLLLLLVRRRPRPLGSRNSPVTGASGGYLVSYPFASALTGFLAERQWDRRFSPAIGAMLTRNVLIYLFGLPWLAVVLHTGLEKTLEDGLFPFVPGDTFELYLTAAALPGA